MPLANSKLRMLVLTMIYSHRAAYFDDWIDALSRSEYFDTDVQNILGLKPRQLAKVIEGYDLVVLLHSCTGDTTRDLALVAQVLNDRKRARLVAFVGNEYNSPQSPMAEKHDVLGACRPDIIATQLLKEAGRYLYDDIAPKVISLAHALNPDAYRPGPEDSKRGRDIAVRNYRYSPLLGDEDRNQILDYFDKSGQDHGLSVDIDFMKRFVRKDWAALLASSRGTVSSEAGSWFLERDDALMRRVYNYVNSRRSGLIMGDDHPLRNLVRRLPLPIKSALEWVLRRGPVKYAGFEDSFLDFNELNELFFTKATRCPAYSKAISSRHFDAIGTKTCQIMLEGRYNDILVPDEHYLEVAHDHSNIDEVIERFKDPAERRRITETAYEFVMQGHTYAHRAAALRKAVEQI